MILTICPFLLGFLICLQIADYNILLQFFLYFCGVCYFSSFISDFIYQGLSLVFFVSLPNSLSIVFIFSKNQLLVSSILSIVFLVFILFISALIFIIYFLLLTLGFSGSFPSSFKCKVRLLSWDFSCFLKWMTEMI